MSTIWSCTLTAIGIVVPIIIVPIITTIITISSEKIKNIFDHTGYGRYIPKDEWVIMNFHDFLEIYKSYRDYIDIESVRFSFYDYNICEPFYLPSIKVYEKTENSDLGYKILPIVFTNKGECKKYAKWKKKELLHEQKNLKVFYDGVYLKAENDFLNSSK